MINLSDKLTAKTIEHIVAESNEIAYHDGDVSSSGNTVADKLTNLSQQVRMISNDEFLIAFIDGLENLLGGIKRDGTWYIPTGIPTDVQTELDTLKDSTSKLIRLGDSDYAWAICDEDENVFLAGKHDGSVYIGKGVPEDVQTLINDINVQITSIQDKLENIEFDEEKNIVINNGVSSKEGFKLYTQEVDPNHSDSNILFSISDKNGNLICTAWKDASFEFENLKVINDIIVNKDLSVKGSFSATTIHADGIATTTDDSEFIYAIVDNNHKVLWGIRNTGNVYSEGITEGARERLNAIESEVSKLEDGLVIANKRGVDWSDRTELRLDIPSVPALVEINGAIPTSKYVSTSGTLKYSDCYGNTFTKEIMWNVQGNISAGFDKKNWGIDLYNSIADDETFEVTFGNWVPQDGFNLKAYISDFWKIRSLGVYRHMEQLSQARPIGIRYPYNTYLGGTYTSQTVDQVLKGGMGTLNGDATCGDLSTGALCHPDGFPVMLYINGNPWGLYTLNLKKSKENYHIIKNDNDAKQLCFGDYMHEVFGRTEVSHWDRGTIITSTAGLEKWDETKDYAIGDIVYDEETFNFEVKGKKSSVTLTRRFRCNAACGPSVKDLYHNSSRPSQINWRQLEVRNPKKTICKEVAYDADGNKTFSFAYYDYDAPMNGEKEYTHELITSADLTQIQAEALGFSKKEYTRTINTRQALDTYSYVLPILGLTFTAQNLLDWGYISLFDETKTYQIDDIVVYDGVIYRFKEAHEAGVWNEAQVQTSTASTIQAQCKKDIFDEHHDLDHNYDFFLVYNDTDYYDSITHNTIYTMYDGKHLVANVYDTDIALGMSSTYTNSFPAVATGLLQSEFCSYLWSYHKDEIKARWAEYRNNGVITEETLESVVWSVVNQVGRKAYEDELNIWPDQPSYRKPVYWRMPAGAMKVNAKGQHVYDETLNKPLTMTDVAKAFSTTTNYVIGNYVIYEDTLYKFIADHTAGEWNAEHVESTTMEAEFDWNATKSYIVMIGLIITVIIILVQLLVVI